MNVRTFIRPLVSLGIVQVWAFEMCRTGVPAKQEAKIVGPSVYSEVTHWVCVLSRCQFFCRVRTGSQSRTRWRHLNAGKSFRQIGKRQGWWAGGVCSALRRPCHHNLRSGRSQGPDAYVRQNPYHAAAYTYPIVMQRSASGRL